MTSRRQILANRENAGKSTGPKTPEGKEQSRRNALKHGLAGAGIVLPEDEAETVARRKAEWHGALSPWDPFEEWLAEEVAVAAVQLERCRSHEALLRTELAERAATRWDDDRRLAAEVLAAGLSKRPALVSRQLQQTLQGCGWMIERWEGLARILEARGDWSGAQEALALDLLGTPAELRDGPTRLDPDPGDDVVRYRLAVASNEIQRLKMARNSELADRDAREQSAAELGLELEPSRPLALLRRYEAACRHRLRWALSHLRHGRPRPATSEPVPTPSASSPPEPFDARPVETNAVPPGIDPMLLADLDELRALDLELGFPPIAIPTVAESDAPPPAPLPSGLSRAVSPEPEPHPASGNRRARRARASQARRA
jgi:hypothetical protein